MINEDVPIADTNDEELHVSIANKMFNLDGYTKETIYNILRSAEDRNKKISLSYLRLLDFKNSTLLEAYRKLVLYIIVNGDSQDVNLIHERFCTIFCEQNASCYTIDECHTLVTAFILLNTDLHSKNISKKMTIDQFIANTQKWYPQFSFESGALKVIYKAVKQKEIKYKFDIVQQRKRSIENDTEKNTEEKKTKNDGTTTLQNNIVSSIENIRNFGFQFIKVKSCSTKLFEKKKSWKSYFGSINNLKLALYKYNEFKVFRKKNTELKLSSPGKIDMNIISWQFIQSHEPVQELSLHHSVAKVITNTRKCELTLIDNSKYNLKVPNGICIENWVHCLNHAASLQSKLPLWTVQGDSNTRVIVQHKWSSEISKLSFEEQVKQINQQVEKFQKDSDYLNIPSKKSQYNKSTLKYVSMTLDRYIIYQRTLSLMNNNNSESCIETFRSSADESIEYLNASNWMSQNSHEGSTSSIQNSSSRIPMSSILENATFSDDEMEL